MKKLSLYAIVFTFALLVALPALAGSVYVPLATDRVIGPYNFTTEITVSNKGGTENRRFSTFFIGQDTDGTVRPGAVNSTLLTPGVSNNFTLGLAEGKTGMLEIDGPPQIAASARLVITEDGATIGRIALPIISSDTVFRSNTTAHLLAWGRDTASGLTTDFGMMNLSKEENSCEIDVNAAGGDELTPTVLLGMKPLSHLHFNDALSILQVDKVDLVRVAVTCSREFYVYSLRYNQQTGQVAFQTPSGTGASTLPTGGAPPAGPGCAAAGNDVCFEEPGIFFTPNPGNPVKRLIYDPPDASYSKLVATLQVRNGGWFPQRMNGTHNIFWLVRDKNRDMFGYVNVRGPNTNDLFIRHGFNLGQSQKPRLSSGFQHPEGATYTYQYTYDTANRIVELIVSDELGTPLLNLRGTPNINSIGFGPNNRILMDFGFPLGVNPNEPPTYNWDYKNLVLRLTPQ